MKKALLSTAAVLAVSGATLAAPAQATATQAAPGMTSLADVLAADGGSFDRDWHDFDILDAAATAVLADDPDSAVGVLADAKKRLTAFAPTDKAFRSLAQDLSGRRFTTEKRVASWLVKNAGLDTIETVLLYHVVPGATLTAAKAAAADGTELTTAQGGTVEVKVRGTGSRTRVVLVDQDTDSPNAVVVVPDINKGNRQIAHGVNRVLRPLDL